MSGLSSIIKLNGFLSGILEGFFNIIFKPITEFINNLIGSLLNWLIVLFYQFLVVPIASIIDALQMLFNVLAGVSSPFYVTDSVKTSYFNLDGNLVLDLLFNSHVMSVLTKLAILSLFLLIIFTFIAIIKAEYSYDGKTVPKSKIIGKSLKALFSFLFVPIISLVGVFASSLLLQALDGATNDGNKTTISTQILIASAYSANRVRKNDAYFKNMVEKDLNYMGIFDTGNSDTSSSDNRELLATMIDNAFRNKLTVTPKSNAEKFDPDRQDGFGKGMNGYDIMFFSHADHFNSKAEAEGGKFVFDATDPYLMFYYYNLWEVNYILCIASLIVVAWIFLKIMLGLTKRLFEVMLLFLASPVAISMMPLDDGKAMKNWKEKFIGRVCMVFAPVVIMNLFIFLLGWISNVDVLSTIMTALAGGNTVDITTEQINATIITTALISPQVALIIILAQNLLNILFIIAGAKIVEESSGWLSKIFGIDGNLVGEGGAIGKTLVDKAKTGIMLASGGGAALAKLGNKGKGPKGGGGGDDGGNDGGGNDGGGAGDGPSNGAAAAPINEGAKMSGQEVKNNGGSFINNRADKMGIVSGDLKDDTAAKGMKSDSNAFKRGFKSLGPGIANGLKKLGTGVLNVGGKVLKAVGSTPIGKIASAPVRAGIGIVSGFKKMSKIDDAAANKVAAIERAQFQRDRSANQYGFDLKDLSSKYDGVKTDDIQKMGNMYNAYINKGLSQKEAMNKTREEMKASMGNMSEFRQKNLIQKASKKVDEAAKIKAKFETAVNEANAQFEKDKAEIKKDKKNK